MTDLIKLHQEFPRAAVSWRAQNVSKDGTKALALAYIDARDVMDRLDQVCGFEGWQDSYVETPKGRVICTISILCGEKWVSKSDGAGDTQVEGDKGAISDAFKRAAVKWGVGRYLYDMPNVWVPCASYEKNGRKVWQRWTADPWSCVPPGRGGANPPQPEDNATIRDRLKAALEKQTIAATLEKLWKQDNFSATYDALPEPMRLELSKVYNDRYNALMPNDPAMQGPGDIDEGHQYQ